MNNCILIEAQYLPPVAYFSVISVASEIIVEKFEHYAKQTYRNRCLILTPQGVLPLVIPVIRDTARQAVRDVRIDYGQKWLNNHWRTIQSAYGKAPFFEYYRSDLEKVLFRKETFLYDLNFALLELCLSWLRCNISVRETSTYETEAGTGITDYRSVISPKKPGACNSFFKSAQYQQVFGSKFVENLSIIDLVFCEGPGAMTVVRGSLVK